jgi:ribonuclease P protein component
MSPAVKKNIIGRQFTFGKYDRLKSRKLIKQLFSEGENFAIYPFRLYYLAGKDIFHSLQKYSSHDNAIILQCGVGASAKTFKKAVDRNRIKRLMRESYRLQKYFLLDILKEKNLQLALFFIYTGKTMPDYAMVSDKIALILHRVAKEIA